MIHDSIVMPGNAIVTADPPESGPVPPGKAAETYFFLQVTG